MALLVVLALGVPVGAIVYLIVQGGNSTLPPASLSRRPPTPSATRCAAGVVADPGRPPDRAALGALQPPPGRDSWSAATCWSWPSPGWSIALAFTYFTEHFLQGGFYQTNPLMVLTYAIMFFPLAVVAVRAAVARSPVGLEEVAMSLGVRRRSVLSRVTLPLIGPGLAAAFGLVFLETATELTATLVLHPDQRADAGHPVLGVTSPTAPTARRRPTRW